MPPQGERQRLGRGERPALGTVRDHLGRKFGPARSAHTSPSHRIALRAAGSRAERDKAARPAVEAGLGARLRCTSGTSSDGNRSGCPGGSWRNECQNHPSAHKSSPDTTAHASHTPIRQRMAHPSRNVQRRQTPESWRNRLPRGPLAGAPRSAGRRRSRSRLRAGARAGAAGAGGRAATRCGRCCRAGRYTSASPQLTGAG